MSRFFFFAQILPPDVFEKSHGDGARFGTPEHASDSICDQNVELHWCMNA